MKKLVLSLYVLLLLNFLAAQQPFKVVDVTYVDLHHDFSMDSDGTLLEAISFPYMMDCYYLYVTISIDEDFYHTHPDLNFNRKTEFKYGSWESYDTTNTNTNFYLCNKTDTVIFHCCTAIVKNSSQTIVRIYSSIPEHMLPYSYNFLKKDFKKGLTGVEKLITKRLKILYFNNESSEFINIKFHQIKLLIDKNSPKNEFMMTFCK